MKARKGISPVLATVIIIAVTLVIAIGVIGWIMGIWGSFGTTESLQVFPDSYINATATTPVLNLHIKNTGTASAVIYKIEIVGAADTVSTTITVTPGQDTTVSVSLTAGAYTPGTYYTVKIYTQAGNIYTAQVRAQ